MGVVVLALSLLALFTTTRSDAQSQILVNFTNQVWRYNQTGADLSVFPWESQDYDDSAWPEGRGVFAYETSVNPLLSQNVYPYTNTVLALTFPGNTSQTITYYFRTHFHFSGTPSETILVSSNQIDDGVVIYVNGFEALRYNIAGSSRPTGSTLAATSGVGEGVFLRLALPTTNLLVGDNVLAVELHQNSATSGDVVWGTALHATVAYPPVITQQPVSTNVLEGRSVTLSVTANAAPEPAYQWFKDMSPVEGANNRTYTITDMNPSRGGNYTVTVSNPYGQVDSSIAVVGFIQDESHPLAVSAHADPFDFSTVTLVFDESVTGALDPFFYEIQSASGGDMYGVSTVSYNASSNHVILTLDSPLNPSQVYRIEIFAGGYLQDYYGNPLADGTELPVHLPTGFRQGFLGYAGTIDTELHSGTQADTPLGAGTEIAADLDGDGIAQGLLRFANVFGNAAGQIPPCAVVSRAVLRFHTLDRSENPVRLLRLRVPWDETSTWNSLANGIDQTNGVETAPDEIVLDTQQIEVEADVTSAFVALGSGEPNGWAFLATGTDGWSFASSEHTNEVFRPALVLEWDVAAPCSILEQPYPVTTWEGRPFTLSVVAQGAALAYQWFRNNVAIPGATNSLYQVSQAQISEQGTYRVEAQSACSGHCTSANVAVVVRCAPDLKISRTSDGDITLAWPPCAGTLLQADQPGGSWTPVVAPGNPLTLPPSGSSRFFKLGL